MPSNPGSPIDGIAPQQALEGILQLGVIGAIDHQAVGSVGRLRAHAKDASARKTGRLIALRLDKLKPKTLPYRLASSMAPFSWSLATSEQAIKPSLANLGLAWPRIILEANASNSRTGRCQPLSRGTFDNIAQAFGEQAVVGLAEHPRPVFIDGADTASGL